VIVTGLVAIAVVFIGVPLLVWGSEWRRRRRTQEERDDAAIRSARDGATGPGDHEPNAPRLPPTLGGPTGF
jgi:hypothetical protein